MSAGRQRIAGDLVPTSPRLLALFRIYVRWYVRRHFHAVRIAHAERCPQDLGSDSARPLIVYINHPSWWDPLTGALVSHFLLPHSNHYSPMDAAALAHYGIFRRMGIFPVEQGTPRGAAQFLRSSFAVVSELGGVLWITPQGAFADVRGQPLSFRSGLAALLARLPGATVLPIAFEYTFWNERLPEILVNVGEPSVFPAGPAPHDLENCMAATLDELAAMSMTRDPAAFHTLLSGSAGIGGIYELWLQLRDALKGRKHSGEHGSIRRP